MYFCVGAWIKVCKTLTAVSVLAVKYNKSSLPTAMRRASKSFFLFNFLDNI